MFPFNIPDTSNIDTIADWVEFYITYRQDEISKCALSSYIEGSSGLEPSEAEINSVWQELDRRTTLYGSTPPFKISSDLVYSVVDWQDIPEYMACLIFSLTGNPTETTRSGRLFERISNEAIRNYLDGKSLIYGHPSSITVRELAEMLNEKFNYEPPRERQDRDLDIIAWKPFEDSRKSQVVLLIQCAAGHNWRSKTKDLNVDAWCRYIHFASHPIKGFSVPIIISNDNKLDEICIDAGMLIDRARLYRYLVNATPSDSLRGDLSEWCQERLDDILH